MRNAARTALRGVRRFRSRWLDGAAILLYHRIGPAGADPFRLSVSPEHFAEHMAAIRAAARPVPLAELVDDLERDAVRAGTVAITFDDGYSDVLHAALPLLEEADLPATVFALANGDSEEFWWDRLARVLGGARETTADGRTAAGSQATAPPPLDRRALHLRLAPLMPSERAAVLDGLEAQHGATGAEQDPRRSLTAEEMRSLAASPLIEIGAHTHTHPPLDSVGGERLEWEVAGGRRALEAALDRPVRSFAYPHGAVSRAALRAVRDAGYAFACGTQADVVWRRSNAFRLPRFWVHDEDGDGLLRRLRSWGAVR